MISDDFLVHFVFGFIAAIIISLTNIDYISGFGIWMAVHLLFTIAINSNYINETDSTPKMAIDGASAAAGYLLYSVPITQM